MKTFRVSAETNWAEIGGQKLRRETTWIGVGAENKTSAEQFIRQHEGPHWPDHTIFTAAQEPEFSEEQWDLKMNPWKVAKGL